MQLWIIRHAHAEREAESGRDFDRALDARGLAEARALNRVLRERGLPEDVQVRVSPAVRALETAAVALADLGLPEAVRDARIWDASPGELLEVARDGLAEASCVLLIGHNPGLEGLLALLTGRRRSLAPGALVVLEVPTGLEPGRASIDFEFSPER